MDLCMFSNSIPQTKIQLTWFLGVFNGCLILWQATRRGDELVINCLRSLAMDAVQQAGGPMGQQPSMDMIPGRDLNQIGW